MNRRSGPVVSKPAHDLPLGHSVFVKDDPDGKASFQAKLLDGGEVIRKAVARSAAGLDLGHAVAGKVAAGFLDHPQGLPGAGPPRLKGLEDGFDLRLQEDPVAPPLLGHPGGCKGSAVGYLTCVQTRDRKWGVDAGSIEVFGSSPVFRPIGALSRTP